MSEKTKSATENRLLIRAGGLALSLPIVLLLGFILILVNIVVGTVLYASLVNSGGIFTAIQMVAPALLGVLVLGMVTLFGLFHGVIRYAGGIHQLLKHLRGIHEEQERIERLMEKQGETQASEFLYREDDPPQVSQQ